MSLQQQIERLGEAVESFVTSVFDLSEDLFLSKLNGWSPRDITAHLIGWNRHVIRGSEQIQRGDLPFYDIEPGDDYSKVNEALVRQYDATDRQELTEELRASGRELKRYLTSLDPGAWDRDFGVRHRGTPVTIRATVDALIADYVHHQRQIEQYARERNSSS